MHSPDRRCSPCTTAASEGWRTWRCSRTSMMPPLCTTFSCATSRDTSMWVSHKLCHTWWPNEALCDPKPEWKCHMWNLPFVHVKINQFEFSILHIWTKIFTCENKTVSYVEWKFPHVNFTFAHVNGFYSHVDVKKESWHIKSCEMCVFTCELHIFTHSHEKIFLFLFFTKMRNGYFAHVNSNLTCELDEWLASVTCECKFPRMKFIFARVNNIRSYVNYFFPHVETKKAIWVSVAIQPLWKKKKWTICFYNILQVIVMEKDEHYFEYFIYN